MILACRQLHKAYGIDVILEKITFHIEEREKAAIVGVNGAGKTTLMRMIAGITGTTEGEIRYDGVEIHTMGKAYRDIFGYLPQEFGFYPGFSVQDYLEYMATLKGLPKGEADRKIKELLSRLTLEDVKRKKISKLSGGMKRRELPRPC